MNKQYLAILYLLTSLSYGYAQEVKSEKSILKSQILLSEKDKTKKLANKIDNLIWNSADSEGNGFDKVALSLNLTANAREYLDKVEEEISDELNEEGVLLNRKTLEIQQTNTQDIVFLRYYLNNQKQSGEHESIISIPIDKSPVNMLVKGETIKNDYESQKKLNNDFNAHEQASRLKQNFPNPFTEKTSIQFEIPAKARSAEIIISDIYGRQIRTFNLLIFQGSKIEISKNEITNGIYLYHMLIDGAHVATKKMVVNSH